MCTFANQTSALGCVITLALTDDSNPERFFLSKNGTKAQQCNMTQNRGSTYAIIKAVDWESDRTEGNFSISAGLRELDDRNDFVTQCSLPGTL